MFEISLRDAAQMLESTAVAVSAISQCTLVFGFGSTGINGKLLRVDSFCQAVNEFVLYVVEMRNCY